MQSYQYTARNTAADSTNKIHSDEAARARGFKGALVPGSATFSQALTPVIRLFGEQWFRGGSAELRFPKPVYAGEEVVVGLEGASPDQNGSTNGVAIACRVGSEIKATGAATVAGLTNSTKRLALVDPPAEPVPIVEEKILDDERLGSVVVSTAPDVLAAYAERAGLPSSLFDDSLTVHPGYLASSYTEIMRANFTRRGPSVHVSTRIVNHKPASVGEPISLRGRVDRLFGRRGNRYWVLDLGWYDEPGELLMTAEHTAIYHLRA